MSTDLSFASLVERPRKGGTWLAGVDVFAREGVDATETTVRFVDGTPGAPEEIRLVQRGRRLDLGALLGMKRPFGYPGDFRLAGSLDWARRSTNERSSADWISPSVTIGAVIPLDEAWAMTGNAARSFRAPRLMELYLEGDRPGGARRANPDLGPESAWSAEAGVRWTRRGWTAEAAAEAGVRWTRRGWTAEAAAWGMVAKDLIVQLPIDAAADTLRNENEATGLLAGVEGAAEWSVACPPSRTLRVELSLGTYSSRSTFQ